MKAVQPVAASWDRMFKVLQIFFRNHRHVCVPPNPRPGSLGRWLAQQQADQRAGKLDIRHFKKLDALGVEFGESVKGVKTSRGVRRSKRTINPGTLAWLNEKWKKRFTMLVAFKKRFGHCDVPMKWPEDRGFAHWVSNQRSFRKKGVLSRQRVDRLTKLGFTWVIQDGRNGPVVSRSKWTGAGERRWERMFEELCKYKQACGHCGVPKEANGKETLSRWVWRQRVRAKKNLMRPDRRRRLDQIGFLWQVRNPRLENWDDQCAKLAAFKKKFGHCNVPYKWKKDPWFGHWVSEQRGLRNRGRLREDRVARLERLGFNWTSHYGCEPRLPSYLKWMNTRDLQWNIQYNRLVQYQKEHGNCYVPLKDGYGGSLREWVQRQRDEGRLQHLATKHRRLLDKIGFNWDGQQANQDRWDKRFAKLAAFKKKYGHCDVPMHWPQDRGFSHWVSNQRSFRKKGVLKQDRIDRLTKLGFTWTILDGRNGPVVSPSKWTSFADRRWEGMFAALLKFKKQRGHCDVPKRMKGKEKLGLWCAYQRKLANQQELRPDRIARLNKLRFRWQGPFQKLTS